MFGLNDTLALGAMRALQESGRRVPEDVAVIGFDDLDEARYSIPSLTTVDPGQAWIARTAVHTLLERIEDPVAAGPPRLLLADFTVAERESALAGPGVRPPGRCVPIAESDFRSGLTASDRARHHVSTTFTLQRCKDSELTAESPRGGVEPQRRDNGVSTARGITQL